MIFRLRQAGKWHAPARCPTYSALSRLPRDLTYETVFDELALHAEFLSFVRERKIACAVLLGFRVPFTGATLPVDALLDLETLQASAGTQATILPRVQDVEEASQGYVAFDQIQDRRSKSKQSRSSPLQSSRKERDLPGDDLCSAFIHLAPSSSPTACLSKDISLALNKATSALPSPSYVCALDARSSVEVVALAGLQSASSLGEVAAEVLKATAALESSSSPDAATILLTGAWRLLPRGSLGNVASSSSLSSSPVVTLSDLHSHDQSLQCAQESTRRRRRWQTKRGPASWSSCFVGTLCFLWTCRGSSHRRLSWTLERKTLLDRKVIEEITTTARTNASPSSSRGTSRRRFCSRTWRLSPSGWPVRTGPTLSAVGHSSFFLRVELMVGNSSVLAAAAASRPHQEQQTNNPPPPPLLATKPRSSRC
jgi:hypothetical protein